MLEKIEIDGFRALARVEVPLKPLTVLIGQNDSGKSSFLAALRYVMTVNAEAQEFDFRDAKRHHRMKIRPTVGGSRPGGWWVDGSRVTPNEHLATLSPTESYVLPSTGVPMNSRGTDHLPTPGQSGEKVAAILDNLLRTDRKRFAEIEAVVREHLPGIDALSIATPDPSSRRVDLVFQSGMKMPADYASTGARLMIFFITLAYHPTPPKLILLEEPENGVHPQRLKQIVTLLREITEGKHGEHAAQIIMTTHSPYLLDSVDPGRDQVLVFRRNNAGERIAEAADNERLKGFLDEFMLGEVWYNQGEDGLIRKRM